MSVHPDGELDLSGSPVIEPLANPGARGGLGLNKAHFAPVASRLFPNDPTSGDIKQQQIGDCYLLAGVLAILARQGGPKTIAGMMKEVNGRVIVRLYDTTQTARYVSIEKSIRKNEEKHNGGAIWATLLEKAYAAASFVEENKPDPKTKDTPKGAGKFVSGYAKLHAGGKSSDVFKVLLGGNAERKEFSTTRFDSGPGMKFLQLWTLEETGKVHETMRADLLDKIFEGDGELFMSFLHWRTNYVKNQWDVLLDSRGDIKNDKDELVRRTVLRQDDLAKFFVDFSLEKRCATKLVDYVQRHNLLPGKRGSGVYTERQITNFDRIKRALAEHKPVALGTTKMVGAVSSGKGKSAGEAMGKGLVGGHAYAVISLREDALPPFRKWIRIRNPWGDTGREYYQASPDSNVLKARAIDAAEYDLELSDLTKRFESLYLGGVPVSMT